MLYCHGHDADLGSTYDAMVRMSDALNADVLGFDYAGYGMSRIGRGGGRRDHRGGGGGDGGKSSGWGEGGGEGEEEERHRRIRRPRHHHHPPTPPILDPPTGGQCRADVLSCYNYLVRRKRVPSRNIVLYGKGLGSGPVCWLADEICREWSMRWSSKEGKQLLAEMEEEEEKHGADHHLASSSAAVIVRMTKPPLGGIVLHSAFSSMQILGGGGGAAAAAGGGDGGRAAVGAVDKFDNVARLMSVHAATSSVVLAGGDDGRPSGWRLPIYLLHGTEDGVIPICHSVGLYEMMMSQRHKCFPPFWAVGALYCVLYIPLVRIFCVCVLSSSYCPCLGSSLMDILLSSPPAAGC